MVGDPSTYGGWGLILWLAGQTLEDWSFPEWSPLFFIFAGYGRAPQSRALGSRLSQQYYGGGMVNELHVEPMKVSEQVSYTMAML